MTFLSRLNYSFDTTKFGDAVDPDGTLSSKLNKAYPILTTATNATYTRAVASNTADSSYYQNPVAGVSGSLIVTIDSIYNLIYNAHTSVEVTDPDTGDVSTVDTYIFRTADLTNYHNALVQELSASDSNAGHNPLSFNSFISHTNRLSNRDRSNKATRPDYNSGITICQQVQTVVYQTENSLTDTTTIQGIGLGCFTSLFIGPDLTVYLNDLTTLLSTANSLFGAGVVANETPAMDTCYNSFISKMASVLNLVQTRRTADENFYANACAVMRDVTAINRLTNSVSTGTNSNPQSRFLVDNYIGTGNFDALRP